MTHDKNEFLEIAVKLGDVKHQTAAALAKRTIKELSALYKVSTVKSKLSALRSMIKQSHEIHPNTRTLLLRYLKLDKDISNELATTYKKEVFKRSKNTRVISLDELTEIKQTVIRLLSNSGAMSKMIALSLLTGRRSCEVLQNGTIELLPSNHEKHSNHVVFTGQRKARHLEETSPYIIPVLADPRWLVDEWNLLVINHRDKYQDLELSVFNNRCTGARKIMNSEFVTKLSVKDMRSLYAAMCLKFLKDDYPDTYRMTPNVYIASILGHSENDLGTANSYQSFKIGD